jgi:hypothetical protein
MTRIVAYTRRYKRPPAQEEARRPVGRPAHRHYSACATTDEAKPPEPSDWKPETRPVIVTHAYDPSSKAQAAAITGSAIVRATEASREAERARADALRDRVASLLAQLATAEAEAKAVNDRVWATGEQLAAAEQRAETERERADRLASSVAHERQDFLDAESRTRRELDGIRERLEQAGESSEAASELRRQVEAAQIAQGEAEAAAAELRQAEAERQGRGLLARLRTAWRGE